MSATVASRALDIEVIGLSRENSGELSEVTDVAIKYRKQNVYDSGTASASLLLLLFDTVRTFLWRIEIY